MGGGSVAPQFAQKLIREFYAGGEDAGGTPALLYTNPPPARITGQKETHPIMAAATRIILILALIFSVSSNLLLAQETTTAATETTATTTATTATTPVRSETIEESADRNSQSIHSRFSQLLRERPPEVGTILQADPSLLSDASFMAKYPEIRDFVAKYPEIQHNPGFYLGEFATPRYRSSLEGVFEGIAIFSVFSLIAFTLAWLVRTIIEQKRWTRLSRTQNEVHNKILDRFSTSAELLDYMKTPSGSKFLESAPIPLHTEPVTSPQNAPLTRVMWSVQIGIVVAAAALGLVLVSGRFDKESAQEMFALGMIGVSLGVGFIVSAAVSMFLSRRLGLWQAPVDRADETGIVR